MDKLFRESRKIHAVQKGTAIYKVGSWAIRDKYLVCDIVENPDDLDLLGFATITVFIIHKDLDFSDEYKKKAWRRYNSAECDPTFDFED